MDLLSTGVDVAIGQIKGYIEPTKQERQAAFELFIELSSRSTTVTTADERRLIRDVLDNLSAMSSITRDVLRRHGTDSAAERADGNIALAAIALRVLNEVILPRSNRWEPLLANHEERRADDGAGMTTPEWEATWDHEPVCRADLESMRGEIRAYLDTLARIAGVPALADLVVPNPPSAPIAPVSLGHPLRPPPGARPRRRMVGWVDPVEGVKTFLAHRRHDPSAPDGRRPATPEGSSAINVFPRPGESLWIDYVSDLGDAVDPTLAVAWQLTRPHLTLPHDRTGELPTPPPSLQRGSVLVMGGDQVYPFASADAYEQQLVLPYSLAAKAQPAGEMGPSVVSDVVVAIPGNHDWLGGPQYFEDVFVHSDRFATKWSAPQEQRWWALSLGEGWWMWGLDTALDNTLDEAQRAYFERMSLLLGAGDQVIVCTPVPLWQMRQKREDDYFHLRSDIDRWIERRGARSPLFLSGDSHFFAHYHRVDGAADEHHVTAGGGGAFLQPTHNLPEHVPYERGATDFKLGQRWPRPVDSRALGASVGMLAQRQFRLLFVIVALFHAGIAGLVRLAGTDDSVGPSVGIDEAVGSVGDVLRTWYVWPVFVAFLVGLIVATVPNSRESSLSTGAKRYGAMHGFAQIGAFVGVAALGLTVGHWWFRFLLAPLVGGVLSVAMFVWFVRWINRKIRANDTLAFSPAHLTRYKHFVRMRLDPGGDLALYVIGIDPVGEGWYDALTTPGGKIPPYDSDGVPRLHYVWGRQFSSADEHLVLERERLLGVDHRDTIHSRLEWAKRLSEDGLHERAVAQLRLAVESCEKAFGPWHPTTETSRLRLATTLGDSGDRAAAIEILDDLLEPREARFEQAYADISVVPEYPVDLPVGVEVEGSSEHASRPGDEQRLGGRRLAEYDAAPSDDFPPLVRAWRELVEVRVELARVLVHEAPVRAADLYRALLRDADRPGSAGRGGLVEDTEPSYDFDRPHWLFCLADLVGRGFAPCSPDRLDGDAIAEAIEMLDRALAIRAEQTYAERIIVLTEMLLGTLLARHDPGRAVALLSRLLEDPELLDDERVEARRLLAEAYNGLGEHELAEQLHGENIVAGTGGASFQSGFTTSYEDLAYTRRLAGDLVGQVVTLERALAESVVSKGADHHDTLWLRFLLASALLGAGDAPAAERLARSVIERVESAGDDVVWIGERTRWLLASAHREMGRTDEAIERLEQLDAEQADLQDEFTRQAVRRDLPRTLESAGQHDRAVAHFRKSISFHRETGATELVLEDLLAAADAERSAGRPGVAAASIEEHVQEFDDAGVEWACRARVSLAECHSAMGRADRAADLGSWIDLHLPSSPAPAVWYPAFMHAGHHARNHDDEPQALRWHRAALDMALELLEPTSPQAFHARVGMAETFTSFGRHDDAHRAWAELVDTHQGHVDDDLLTEPRLALAQCLLQREDPTGAARVLDELHGGLGAPPIAVTTQTAEVAVLVGDPWRAIALLEDVRVRSAETADCAPLDVVRVEIGLANAYVEVGDVSAALQSADVAFRTAARLLAQDHELRRKATDVLARATTLTSGTGADESVRGVR